MSMQPPKAPPVTIILAGVTGCGKTALGLDIAAMLKERGFDVEFFDEGAVTKQEDIRASCVSQYWPAEARVMTKVLHRDDVERWISDAELPGDPNAPHRWPSSGGGAKDAA